MGIALAVIDPHGVYDDGGLRLALGITSATLATARRQRRLRFSRKGRRTLYLGQWVIDWLQDRDGEMGDKEDRLSHRPS